MKQNFNITCHGGRESLLSPEQQTAIKTNLRRAVGHLCPVFLLEGRGRRVTGFQRIFFFSVDGSEVTGAGRRCVNKLQRVAHKKGTIVFLLPEPRRQTADLVFSQTAAEGITLVCFHSL